MIGKITFFIKRLFDIVISLIALSLGSIFFISVLVINHVKYGEGVFFKQKRVGKNGTTFCIIKFKTMRTEKNAEENFDFSKDNQRITPFGKVLRRTKIDELPQIINVLKGEMSIVGPRPTIENQVEKYTDREWGRLRVKPGMTGLAQVNGNIYLSWHERINYDLSYIENFSLILDFKIIIKTILIVIFGEKRFINRNKGNNQRSIER